MDKRSLGLNNLLFGIFGTTKRTPLHTGTNFLFFSFSCRRQSQEKKTTRSDSHCLLYVSSRISVPGTDKDMDLSDHGNTTPGTPVELWGRWVAFNQVWYFEKGKVAWSLFFDSSLLQATSFFDTAV